MSQSIICHISPKGGIDDRIAQFLNNGYTKEQIGTLRGLYDMDNRTPLIDPLVDDNSIQELELAKIAHNLMEYKIQQSQRHLKELKDSTAHMASTFNRLYHVPGWNATTRRNRINMVASLFTQEVSRRVARAKKAGISLTRTDVVNGYKRNGQFHEGSMSVFETVFDQLLEDYNKARLIVDKFGNKTPEEIEKLKASLGPAKFETMQRALARAEDIVREYPKVFQNWSALCAFARMSLRDTESLKLGQTFEYAAPTTPDNFVMESPLEDTYDLEESVREAWMTQQSETSAFGSLGAEVRRFLATIPDVDSDGNNIIDDLGFLVKMDPVETHQYLAEILRGITSESGIIRKLYSLSKTDTKVKAIFNALAKASSVSFEQEDGAGNRVFTPISDTNKPKYPVIITQLLGDMHKNMVPYSALIRLKDGAKSVVAKVLNRQDNPLHDEFVLGLEANRVVDPGISIYDSEGKVDWEKLTQWLIESKALLPSKEESEAESNNIFSGTTKYATGFWDSNFSYAQRIDYMKRAARALGINLTTKAATRIYNNKPLRNDFLKSLQEFRVHGILGAGGSGMREHLAVLEKYNGFAPTTANGNTAAELEEYNQALDYLKTYNSSNATYSLLLRKTYGKNQKKSIGAGLEKINKILDVIASVTDNLKTERRVPWFDRKGKANSRYSDRTPSYMGDLVDKIKEFVNEGDAQGLKDFIMDRWGRSSFFYDQTQGRFLNRWIQELYDSIQVDSRGNVTVDRNSMAKIFEFDEFLGSNIDGDVNIFENFTEKQHAEAMLKQFVQLYDQSNGKRNLAKYPCFILGDSGAQMFFTARKYSRDSILQGMMDVFRQEIERMKYVTAVNESLAAKGYKFIENFSETADEFTMLKFFNHDFADGKYWKILTGNEEMSAEEFKKLSRSQAVEMARQSLGTDALRKAIEEYVKDAKKDFMKKLVSVGVLKEFNDGNGNITYAGAKGYFDSNLRHYNNDIEAFIDDFFWNTKYATIQQLQMFTVDPAFYDHKYPIKDLQKRYKEIYAPGKGISIEARDYNGNLYAEKNGKVRSYETAVYFDDVAVSSEDVNPYFMKMIEDTFGKDSKITNAYKNNTLTDGQGYRSLSSYRAVKGMAGEWTMAMEEAYKRIMAIRNSNSELTEEDVKEIAKLAVIFQPIKPYLYTLEKYDVSGNGSDVALIPVQHKYAEIVLIPELMQEGKLRDMAVWMEQNDVDLLASTKCVKVGSFGSVDINGVNNTDDIHSTLSKALVHKLPWSDYRIQSGVPEHLNHAQLFGTQIRKLILTGIDKGKNYDYLSKIFGTSSDGAPTINIPGFGIVPLNGRRLISLYNCLIMANMFDSYDLFSEETATNKKLSDRMIQNIISNSSQAEDNAFAFALIDGGEFDGEFVVPPGEPGLEHDSSALLNSMFKKQVNKQKIKGGSAVQASALGLSGYEEAGDLFEVVSPEGDNVLYDEVEMPWNLSYTSSTGKNISLKFEDWCNIDGTLKMSDQIVYGEDAREYLSWPVSGRDKYGRAVDPSQGYYVPLIETKYKGILDIIAYRIPTERDYSMINCKVYRFSNPLSGGVMKVPSSRTTTAGFDFDIDKLYFFMREFAQTHLSEKQIEDIWNAIYEEHPQWKEALQNARDIDKKGADLLSSISKMFKNDMSGIGEANEKAKSKDRLYNYWESAGLEGTPEEAFTKYLEDHRNEYPVFDIYNPKASPLNPVVDSNGNIITKGNSRVARNNLLIDLMRCRLMDKETLKARYTPGGFENNRDAALRMRVLQFADKADIITNGKVDWAKIDRYVERINKGELKDPEPEYDVSDPTAILVYNQQNQVAGKLIGIFANHNTNHVYASTLSQLGLVNAIRFGSHTSNGLKDLINHSSKDIGDVDVDTNVAEYLAASVDAVKDPVLNFLNLNLTTASAGALLARLGYTPHEIGLLFNQPIIKDVCNYVANEGVQAEVAVTEMLYRYGGKNASLKNIVFDSNTVTNERLADNILTQRSVDANKLSSDFKQGQLQVLWLFSEIMKDAQDMDSFIKCTRFTAANSVGSTFGDLLAQEEQVQSFIDKYVKDNPNSEEKKRLSFVLFDEQNGEERSLEEGNVGDTKQGILNISEDLLDLTPNEYMAKFGLNPFAFEQCMMDLLRKASRKLYGKHFPYHTALYGNMRNQMKTFTKRNNLDADTINSLHREFMLYLLSKNKGSKFDGEALDRHFGKVLTNREYYTKEFPKLLFDLKAEGVLDSYPLFNFMSFKGNNTFGSIHDFNIVISGMGGLQASSSNLITEAWAEAFNSNEAVQSVLYEQAIPIKTLAEDLYFYNIYKLGYNFHPTSSMSLAPTILKLGLTIDTDRKDIDNTIGYIDFINDVIAGKVKLDGNDLMLFAKQYVLNHPDNFRFVFTPKGIAKDAVKGAYNEGWNSQFSVALSSLKKEVQNQFKLKDLPGNKIAYRPFVAVEREGQTAYYMADSPDFNIIDSNNGVMTFKRIFPQGLKGQHIQYFGVSAFDNFQNNYGSLKDFDSVQRQRMEEEGSSAADGEITEISGDVVGDGVVEGSTFEAPETSFTEVDTDVTDMFSDAEWQRMFDIFREDNKELFAQGFMQSYNLDTFKRSMSDTSNADNVARLNDLSKRIDRGEKQQTIDEEGNPIDVC